MITPVSGLALEHNAKTPPALARAYGPWVGIRSNHVVTQSGEFFGSDFSSRSISNETDRQLLIALRSMADVIMVDAATARRELYRAPKSGAFLAIFSNSGNFEGIPAVTASPEKTLLFATKSNSANQEFAGSPRINFSEDPIMDFVEQSHKKGFRACLLEAGPSLTNLMFSHGLVSQSALTITPKVQKLLETDLGNPFDSNARLVSLAEASDSTFSYWLH